MIGCSLRGFPALRLAGFPPYEEIASVQFLMKSSSLHPCNKCGLYPARLHADSRWSFPHLLHRLIWCMRLTKVCRWENIFFNCVCFSHKQDQNYLLFLWLHIEPCTITTVGQIQVQRDTSATGKHWRGLMCLPGSGRWCPTASAVLPAESKVREPLCESASFLHDVWTCGPGFRGSSSGPRRQWYSQIVRLLLLLYYILL